MGQGADDGVPAVPGGEVPHGRAADGTVPERALERRLGDAAAGGELSDDLRRYVVDLARSERLPRLHRTGPVRAARQYVSQGRWFGVAAGADERQGGGDGAAVRAAGAGAGTVRRPAHVV